MDAVHASNSVLNAKLGCKAAQRAAQVVSEVILPGVVKTQLLCSLLGGT